MFLLHVMFVLHVMSAEAHNPERATPLGPWGFFRDQFIFRSIFPPNLNAVCKSYKSVIKNQRHDKNISDFLDGMHTEQCFHFRGKKC